MQTKQKSQGTHIHTMNNRNTYRHKHKQTPETQKYKNN